MAKPKKQVKEPKFLYISSCCQVPATKEPCERSLEDKKAGEWSQSTLGTWNCGKCGRKCSVTPTKAEVK